jgi:hypothetical protein
MRDSDQAGDFAIDDDIAEEEDDESDARAISKALVRNSQSDCCSFSSRIHFKLPPRLKSFEE